MIRLNWIVAPARNTHSVEMNPLDQPLNGWSVNAHCNLQKGSLSTIRDGRWCRVSKTCAAMELWSRYIILTMYLNNKRGSTAFDKSPYVVLEGRFVYSLSSFCETKPMKWIYITTQRYSWGSLFESLRSIPGKGNQNRFGQEHKNNSVWPWPEQAIRECILIPKRKFETSEREAQSTRWYHWIHRSGKRERSSLRNWTDLLIVQTL